MALAPALGLPAKAGCRQESTGQGHFLLLLSAGAYTSVNLERWHHINGEGLAPGGTSLQVTHSTVTVLGSVGHSECSRTIS